MKFVVIFITLFCSFYAFAQDIASCSEPRGKGYFPEIGLVSKKDSGWSDEEIAGGITKVVKLADSGYDILFVDTRQDIISARQTGGHVLLLNRGKNVFSMLVIYPSSTAEVYTFLEDNSGNLEYVHVLSRAGDAVLITKSSLMRGSCSYINFDVL